VANEAQPSAQWPDQGNDTSKPAPPAASKAEGLSDAELVRRVRDADGAALSQLYPRFVRPCYSLGRRICVDEKPAEDVVQEVFLTLWRDPTRYDPPRGGFVTWLLTVTHHRAVDAVRKESTIRRRVVAVPEAGEAWSPTPAPAPTRRRWRVSRPARSARHCIASPPRSTRCSPWPTSVGTLRPRLQFRWVSRWAR